MDNPQLLVKANLPTWVKILLIILIFLSIFLRFPNLGQKFYCCDESWTSLAISGYTVSELKQELSHYQEIIPLTRLDKYQHINSERNITDTVNYLITSDPQHPPLYYVMVRLWAQVFGDSAFGVRSLSALISLLIFPSVYWLCLELFASPVVGWLAIALLAVSPLQFFFAREARQYTLWMVEILVSSAALLAAIRQENRRSWSIYSISLVLGLYTHLFTILVMIPHAIYIVINQSFHFSKTFRNYLGSTTFALLIFSPWLIVIIKHISTAIRLTSGLTLSLFSNPFELIAIFLIRVSRTFFDLNLTSDTLVFDRWTLEGSWLYIIPALIFSLILIIYLIYFYITMPIIQNILLILLLGGFSSILLISYDLISGGTRSLQVRYQLPLYLSLEIIVAYMIAFHIFQEQIWRRRIAQVVIGGLLIAGLVSDVAFFKSPIWWIQSDAKFIQESNEFLNQSDQPLLVVNNSSISLGGLLTLSHNLPNVNLLYIADHQLLPIPDDYSHIFFIQDNSVLFHQLKENKNYLFKANITLKPSGGLWEFDKIG